MNKNIFIVGAIAAGLYMLSQGKKTTKVVAKKKAPRRPLRLYPKPHPYLKPKIKRVIAKKKKVYNKPKIKKAAITSTQAARKQREKIAAAHRAVLQNAKKIREQMAAENRKAAARKKKKHIHL